MKRFCLCIGLFLAFRGCGGSDSAASGAVAPGEKAPRPAAGVPDASGGAGRSAAGQDQRELLRPNMFAPCDLGAERDGKVFVCDNGGDAKAARGVEQRIEFWQTVAWPLFAVVQSKAEGVGGGGRRLLGLSGRPADRRQGRLRQARGLRRGNARLAAQGNLSDARKADRRGLVPRPLPRPRRQGLVQGDGALQRPAACR